MFEKDLPPENEVPRYDLTDETNANARDILRADPKDPRFQGSEVPYMGTLEKPLAPAKKRKK